MKNTLNRCRYHNLKHTLSAPKSLPCNPAYYRPLLSVPPIDFVWLNL